MTSAERQSLQMSDSRAHSRRSSGVNFKRLLAELCSTVIWCRKAKFSSTKVARERKIEETALKSVVRKISIHRIMKEG
jgi:hypothetical protein